MRRKEIIPILLLAIACIVVIGYQQTSKAHSNRTLVIEVDNKSVLEKPITNTYSDEFQVPLANGEATVLIEDGKVRVVKPDIPNHTCPKGICYAMGWIEKPGESIVCLPNKLILTIVKGK